MPISLRPTSRRRFLQSSIAASAGVLLGCDRPAAKEGAASKGDPDRFALLSDVHIHADKATKRGETVVWETMAAAVREVVGLDPRPAGVIVNGDCAHMQGRREDYATFIEAIDP